MTLFAQHTPRRGVKSLEHVSGYALEHVMPKFNVLDFQLIFLLIIFYFHLSSHTLFILTLAHSNCIALAPHREGDVYNQQIIHSPK